MNVLNSQLRRAFSRRWFQGTFETSEKVLGAKEPDDAGVLNFVSSSVKKEHFRDAGHPEFFTKVFRLGGLIVRHIHPDPHKGPGGIDHPFIAECVLLKFQAGDTPIGIELEKDGFSFLPGSIKNSWVVRLPGNAVARLPGATGKKTQGQQAESRTSFQQRMSCKIPIHPFPTIVSDKPPKFPSIHLLTPFSRTGYNEVGLPLSPSSKVRRNSPCQR